jgi:hypothetical protein
MLGVPTGCSEQPFPSYSGLWIGATTSDCRTVRTVGACKHKIKVEWWERVHLPGQSGTRLTAYHISQYVASTFKNLATTTTHIDLINF